MIELANVAGPRVVEQRLQGGRLEARQVLPVSLRMLPEKVSGERRDVFAAVAERRQLDLDGVEPEQEILTKAPGADFFSEV